MATPTKESAPGRQTGSAQNITATRNDSTTVVLDFPQTTRTCSGAACWCRIGDYPSPLVMDHAAELARMAREIRSLEIACGVLGL